ncbi:MAG: dTDP-4-dehydrorhamnose reductase [Fimbriimonadaceae bacterium]
MKVLVLGGSGMLGTDLCAELRRRGFAFEAPRTIECDITNPTSLATFFEGRSYDFVVNCAAYTAVDLAESEQDSALLVNSLGAGYLAQICSITGAKLIHISTDFVFDGLQDAPYSEDAVTNPLSVYGSSKLEGERSVLATGATVVRTAWLYGVHGKSFPRTIIGAWQAGKTLRVVGDQIGCPTSTVDLSRVLVDLIELGAPMGMFHACGPEAMSWHEFACRAILAASGEDVHDRVVAIKTEEWPTPAKRPRNSVLADSRLMALGIAPMRPVNESLGEFVTALGS